MSLSIGQAAQAAGVNVETLRYYERRGLLMPGSRTDAGYRQYSEDDLWRLSFIKRAQGFGFTLADIADLLALSTPADIRSKAAAKLRYVDAQLEQLVTVRDRLRQLVAVCEAGPDGDCTALNIDSPDKES
jgi:DNA-binding transcriptional MerR regulator